MATGGPKATLPSGCQQEILAELGVIALQRTGFAEPLDRAVQLAAEGLNAELCKILEYMPEDSRMLMRAGVGWDPDLVGVARVPEQKLNSTEVPVRR